MKADDKPSADVTPLESSAEGSVRRENDSVSPSRTSENEVIVFQQLLETTTNLDAKIQRLNELVQDRLSYDKTKEEAFERLYGELEPLKSNASFEQLRPLYLDLILLFDRIENIHYSLQQSDKGDQGTLSLFRSLSDELLEVLYRREIEVIPSPTLFDPTTQKAIGLEQTTSEGEGGLVAKVVRRGFRYHNRLVRAEEVIVKKFVPGTAEDKRHTAGIHKMGQS